MIERFVGHDLVVPFETVLYDLYYLLIILFHKVSYDLRHDDRLIFAKMK